MLSPRLLVSFVISTHNRRDVLLNTLIQINACGLPADAYEILVVDNASTDHTVDAVTRCFPRARLFPQPRNLGPVAKNIGIEHAQGRYVVFLDDDSYPQPGAVRRMIQHFESDCAWGRRCSPSHFPTVRRNAAPIPMCLLAAARGFGGALSSR